MGETDMIVRLPGSLDPNAEEFRPNSVIECRWYPLTLTLPMPMPMPLLPPPHLSTSSTRSLLLTPVPPVSHSLLRSQLQAFGDLRHLQTEALRHGILTVHFYDLRHAQTAFSSITSMHLSLSPRPISAHYVLPSSNSLPDAHNQGTLLLFDLDPHLSTHHLPPLFLPFGPIKEFRDTPSRNNQILVEFFDTRHAANAFKHLNGKLFHGKPLSIQFSTPFHHTKASIDALHLHRHSLNAPTRSSSNSNHNCHPTLVGTPKQPPRSRHFKGKQAKKHDTRFLIKEEHTDARTTVMIKNIPNKYSQKLLLNMLDNHCIHCNEQIADGHEQPLSSYDFVYLPIDFNNKCNVGYGFVNMTSPEATLRLYKAFHLQHWEVFNSRKICQVTYARVQGLEALKEHFKNSKFPCEMEHYLPVVFSPPRDGRELTEPLPVVGNRQQSEAIESDDVGGCDE